MRKHEMSYYNKTNIIKLIFDFCTHTETNKEKNILFRKKSFSDQPKRKILENSKKNIEIVIKILSRKDRESNNLSRKDYKSNQSNQVVFSKSELNS